MRPQKKILTQTLTNLIKPPNHEQSKFFREVTSKFKPIPGRTLCIALVGKKWLIGINDRENFSNKWRKKYKDSDTFLFTRHAEEHLLSQLLKIGRNQGKYIKKLLVLRWDKHSQIGCAKPCESCERKLISSGINKNKIFFSTTKGTIQEL